MTMNSLLKIEEFFLILLSLYLFQTLDYAWWWFALLFLAPDLSMLGYLVNPHIGAVTYNLAHHRGVALALYLVGVYLTSPPLQLAGILLLGHTSFDRLLGYGLKYPDSFQHTHLGMLAGR